MVRSYAYEQPISTRVSVAWPSFQDIVDHGGAKTRQGPRRAPSLSLAFYHFIILVGRARSTRTTLLMLEYLDVYLSQAQLHVANNRLRMSL